MADKKIATGYIGNALRSSAADHTTTFTDEVFDTERQKYQSEVNTDIEKKIETELEARDLAINAEAQARMQNDQLLSQAIAAEQKRAEAAEQAIIFDVSARNNGAVFESLSALLSSSDLSTLIPASVRHGGMIIRFILTTPAKYNVVKTEGLVEQPIGTEIISDPSIVNGTYEASQLSAFSTLPAELNSSLTYYLAVTETVDEQEVTTYTSWVIIYAQSSDNKYVQFRLMSDTFNTTVANWQGVDDEPIAGNNNLVKSDGVYKKIHQLSQEVQPLTLEIGTILGGEDASNTKCARTIGYILGPLALDVANEYIFVGAHEYTLNPDGTYSYAGWKNYEITGLGIVLNGDYYRLVFKRTDGADFSLSDLNKIITGVRYPSEPPILGNLYEPIDTSDWLKAYVNTDCEVISSTISLCSQPILLEKGQTLFVETVNNYLYPIITVSTNQIISIGDTLTPLEKVIKDQSVSKFKLNKYKLVVHETCYAVVSVSAIYNHVYVCKNEFLLVSKSVKDRLLVSPDEADMSQYCFINSYNKWEKGGQSVCFEVLSGSNVKITANSAYNTLYALLKKPFTGGDSVEFIEGETGRHIIPINTSVEITIPEDCLLYIYVHTASLQNYYPYCVNIYYPRENQTRLLNISSADGYLNKGISGKNVWRIQSVRLPASCYFNVYAGDKIVITANSTSFALVAFLKDTVGEQDELANFANNTNSRITIDVGTSQTFEVSENCLLYVYIQADTLTDFFAPEKILLTCSNAPKDEIKVTRHAINLVKTVYNFTGVSDTGKLVFDTSHVAVGPVLIKNGSEWYKKTRYIHACCFNGGLYAFNATKIVFLTDAKSVINISTNISNAIEIPTNAYWAVVEFPVGSTMHFVAINNQSLLKTYSAYDECNLVADVLPIYDKIQNTDGAISRMIDVALDYMPYPYLGMGYGDIATAFDDVVEPVESEFSPQYYDGKKLQMNCSTFVMLCLMGVFYKNSRYNIPSGKNVGDGYRFDDQAEYNYFYTKAPYQYIFGADFGKMYANKLAKYAFDRGLLYLIKPDLSNIEAGDVLFSGSTVDGNFFMNIGHTMLVVDVELKADGTNRVTIFETAAGERVITYDKEHWGARFPLPNRNIIFDNIVSGFEPISESISTDANNDVTLGTYTLTKHIQSKKHYTLEIIGELPDSVNVGIKGGAKTVEINRRELYKRGDGVNTKHFWFLMNDSVDISQISLYINSSISLSEQTIKINSLKISEGYFAL